MQCETSAYLSPGKLLEVLNVEQDNNSNNFLPLPEVFAQAHIQVGKVNIPAEEDIQTYLFKIRPVPNILFSRNVLFANCYTSLSENLWEAQ